MPGLFYGFSQDRGKADRRETANVWDDCVQLAPDAHHSLDLCLWSEAMASTT